MRTLFITHHYLYGRSGSSYASTAYVNAFAAISESLTLLYPDNGNEPFAIDKKVKRIPINNKGRFIVRRAIEFVFGYVHRFADIAPRYAKEKYDVVVFDTSVVSFRLIDLFRATGIKTICIHHNYQYDFFRDNFKGIRRLIELFWCKRYEKEAVQKCDLNLTLTNQDIDLLKLHYGKGKEVFQKIGVFEYRRIEKRETLQDKLSSIPVFVITGSLESVQTEESILPWLADYYPILMDVFPEHRLLIAGRNPSDRIRRACAKYDTIELIANPADMDDVIDKALYYICPTSLGGGLKLRIMDGLSQGLPVCTHEVSARGYEAFLDKCLFPYHDAQTFREAMINIQECELSRQDIINMYKSEFSFDAGVERLEDILIKH